jgi:Ni/Co efflux regulator RcnB
MRRLSVPSNSGNVHAKTTQEAPIMRGLATLALVGAMIAASLAPSALAQPRGKGRDNPHNPHAQGRHDNGLHRGWDRRRFNGYVYRGVWYYGPPPPALADVVLGYRVWRRGERLPAYYLSSFPVVDYRLYHLAPPPRGYHYVRDDRGDYLLIGIATGVVLGVVLAGE